MSGPQKSASHPPGLFGEPAANAAARGAATANIDGGARGNPGPAAYGIVLRGLDGATLLAAGKCIGGATNNVAEYYALIAALDAARERGITRLRVESDSELLVRQVEGRYRVKSPDLKPLHERALKLSRALETFEIVHVPREKNREADRLVNAALDGEDVEHRSSTAATPREGADRRTPPAERIVRARVRDGVLVPEAVLDLAEGSEVIITVKPVRPRRA